MTYKWINYDNGYYERAHWFFEFFDERNRLLGRIDNRPDQEDENLIEDGYKLKTEKDAETIELGPQEIIAGLKMGLDDETDVVSI